MALEHYLRLSLTDGIGPILIGRMIELAGSAEAAVKLALGDLQCVEGIGTAKAGGIFESLRQSAGAAEQQIAFAQKLGARIVCREDAEYPELLRTIPDPPVVLYVLGSFEPRDLQSLAMVGSRRCSHYGREQAERFGALLAGAGVTVVSGGARGIDSAAHRGALSHPQGRTIAVLGCGLDIAYPPENAGFFKQIAGRGVVASEFPFGTPPNAENFPRRNRIVSGMSRGVLVIEADERSGALITARLANEDQGRPVFALPGRVDNRMSLGCHKLIRDGATLVTCLDDIMQGLDPLPHPAIEPTLFGELAETAFSRDDPHPGPLPKREPGAAARAAGVSVACGLTDRQSLILRELGDEPAAVDQLIERTGLEASVVLQELTFLSLKAVVRRVDGQTYMRGKHR